MNNILLKKIYAIFIKIWDYIVFLLESITFKKFSRSFISFGLVGITGGVIQILTTNIFIKILNLIPTVFLSNIFSVTFAFLLNNFLTFKKYKLKGTSLIKGFFKNLFFESFTILARSFLAILFVKVFFVNVVISQILSIGIGFIWRYLITSKIIWKLK